MPSATFTRVLAAASTLAAVLLFPVHAAGGDPEPQATSLFLYQGQLARNGVLVSGPVDLQFSLWSSRTGGVQLGRTITVRNLNVIDGWVSRQLNFGAGNDPNGNTPFFTGAQRFVQISVRAPAGPGAFVPLNPRQEIRPTPYSLLAFNALRAFSVDWANVENAPLSFGGGLVGIPTGRLGIGTPNPDGLLDVRGAGFGAQFVVKDLEPGTGNLSGTQLVGEFRGGPNANPQVRFESERTGFTDIGLNDAGDFVIESTDAPQLSVTQNGRVGVRTATPRTGLDVRYEVGFVNDPAAIFTVGNCGAACAQEDRQEAVRLQNTNANGQVGMGFVVSGVTDINRAPDVWMGTGYGATANSFILATKTGTTTLTNRFLLNGDTGNIGMAADPDAGAVLNVGGNVRCVAVIETSAREFKAGIEPLSGALENVLKLRGVTYAWNDQAPESVRGQKDLGFIADEVQAVFPDMVAKDAAGNPIGIKYTKFAPVAVEAIKQLKAENNELRARLERLEALVERQTAAGGVR
jgi:hypothetical protein